MEKWRMQLENFDCLMKKLAQPREEEGELRFSPIVVHPKYQSIGLGAKLVRETLPWVGTPYVEMIAVMAKYNPFAEKAGMRKVAVQEPKQDIIRVARILESLGFELKLLKKHAIKKLDLKP